MRPNVPAHVSLAGAKVAHRGLTRHHRESARLQHDRRDSRERTGLHQPAGRVEAAHRRRLAGGSDSGPQGTRGCRMHQFCGRRSTLCEDALLASLLPSKYDRRRTNRDPPAARAWRFTARRPPHERPRASGATSQAARQLRPSPAPPLGGFSARQRGLTLMGDRTVDRPPRARNHRCGNWRGSS